TCTPVISKLQSAKKTTQGEGTIAIRLALALALLLAATLGNLAQAPTAQKPGDEHARFAAVGKWNGKGETVVAGKPLHERGTNVVTADTITTTWEYSTDGAKWLPNFEAKATRAK